MTDWLAVAQHQAYRDLGLQVDAYKKSKGLRKFGRANVAQDTPTTISIWPSGIANETFTSTNSIDSLTSSDNGDTEPVLVEGHTISGGLLTFAAQTVTLTGQTAATLGTPLARMTRIRNSGSSDLAGTIYGYDDTANVGGLVSGVPQTDASVHCMIEAGKNQSEKLATSLSSVDAMFVTRLVLFARRSTGGTANIDFEMEYREIGGVWLPLGVEASLRTSDRASVQVDFGPYAIVPPNSDVRMVCTSSTAAEVSGHWQSVLALVVG